MDKSLYCIRFGFASKAAARRAATRRNDDIEGIHYELFQLGSGRWQWMPLDKPQAAAGGQRSADAECKP